VLERWRREFGLELDEASLRPCFERVERALSVTEVTPELAGNNAAVARRGAEHLGWSHGYLRRNTRGRVGSGVCAFGCPTSAKQHTGITYVPRARATGAEVLHPARVRRVLVRRGRAHGVDATGADGSGLAVRAPMVIVDAGTIHTPLLLAASGLGAGSGELGRNLSLHPATAAFALMDEVVVMARGVPQSFYIDEVARERIIFESVAGPPSYAAMSLPLAGAAHARAYGLLSLTGPARAGGQRRLARVRALGRRPCGGPLRPFARGSARVRAGLRRLEQLFHAAGAREVYLTLPAGVSPERARARDLKLMAFHPLGTARADVRPSSGVVDGDLALHGTRGVYIADGSVVPSALGVNPQMTIMALATRLAFELMEEPCPS
jgi:choline dehydrogenase-like flavoprotein